MTEHKRLDDSYMRKDIKEFLIVNKDTIKDGGFYIALDWIKEYEQKIEENKKYIADKIQQLYPKSVVKLQDGYDDTSSFYAVIYGKDDITDINAKYCEKNGRILHVPTAEIDNRYKEPAYDACSELEKEFVGYSIFPSFKSLETTKEYYPDIYEELIKKTS